MSISKKSNDHESAPKPGIVHSEVSIEITPGRIYRSSLRDAASIASILLALLFGLQEAGTIAIGGWGIVGAFLITLLMVAWTSLNIRQSTYNKKLGNLLDESEIRLRAEGESIIDKANKRAEEIARNAPNQIEYYESSTETFEALMYYVRRARNQIYVSRFSNQTIPLEHEYHILTKQKILGNGCDPVNSYNRLIEVNTLDKAQFVVYLLENIANENRNTFYIRDTEVHMFYDMLIIDDKHLFLFFHDSDKTGRINCSTRISNSKVVRQFVSIFHEIWRNEKISTPIRTGTQKELNESLKKYQDLVARFVGEEKQQHQETAHSK